MKLSEIFLRAAKKINLEYENRYSCDVIQLLADSNNVTPALSFYAIYFQPTSEERVGCLNGWFGEFTEENLNRRRLALLFASEISKSEGL